ncbi:oligopeptide/dipeptide ABC transporter ATPase [Enterobacter cloacae]|uniref:Oligopeptide/dipeptide ABC transporter ATPase n=1 Tax=Enterobacter cloacae TaxID=550 RepID=A0A377M7H7_ENTCL|nr:oligopeptide/dipeptide ABC transporter ATPase [Enterobacter cloacae]
MTTIPFKEATPVLRLQKLNVKFAGSPVSVLDGISLTVKAVKRWRWWGSPAAGKVSPP